MRQNLLLNLKESQRFRKPVRKSAAVSAVIHRTDDGFFVELSNGRMCSLSRSAFGPGMDAITAAVQWARRHGAVSVEIAD